MEPENDGSNLAGVHVQLKRVSFFGGVVFPFSRVHRPKAYPVLSFPTKGLGPDR